MIKTMKKSIFLFTFLATYFAPLCAQDAAWYETDEWYEQELGAKKGEANPIHLAITLAECFSHDPQDFIVFNKVIKFWLNRGGNINQTFILGDFISRLSGKEALAQLPAWYKTLTVTVITSCCGSEYIVRALLAHQAKVMVHNVNGLEIWVKQYQDILAEFQESKMAYTNDIDEMFQSQYASLKLLFAACDVKHQEEFLQKYPECENLMQVV